RRNVTKESCMATILSRERELLITSPAPLESPAEAPATSRRVFQPVLTIEPASFLNREGARVFRAANYVLRPVRAWHHAVEWIERGDMDLALFDLDMLDASVTSTSVSSARLVTLMRRASTGRPLIIAGISRRDYSEIEDTLRAGVDVFVGPQAS